MSDVELAPTQEEQLAEIDDLLNEEPITPEADEEGLATAESAEGDQTEETPEETEETEEEAETEEAAEGESDSIDYDLVVPQTDGRDPMTVGDMKDRLSALERTEADTIERENAILRDRQQLNELYQITGGEIPPEAREMMAQQQERMLKRESDSMFQAIPEWKERSVFEADRAEIAQLGANYGFNPQELSQVVDHRIIKLLRDHTRLLSAQKKAKEAVVPLKKKQAPKGKIPPKVSKQTKLEKQIAAASQSHSEQDKIAAIDALLTG